MPQVESEEQFSLKWNDFQMNLTTGFQHLLEEELMLDVSLSAGGQLIQAHKIILSICSPYFKALFQTNPCKHPVIILKDVGSEELLDVLEFMYRGEASIKKENLTAFLKLAESLKIKGLVDNSDEESERGAELPRKVPVKKKLRFFESSTPEKKGRQETKYLYLSSPPKKRKKKLTHVNKLEDSAIDNSKDFKDGKSVKRFKVANDDETEKIDVEDVCANTLENKKTEDATENNSCEKTYSMNNYVDSNVDNDDDDFGDDDFGPGPSNSDDNADNLPSDHRRAPIWCYFVGTKNQTVKCRVCSKVFPNKKNWGTANMKRHLKLHPLEDAYVRALMQKEVEHRTTANMRLTNLFLNALPQ